MKRQRRCGFTASPKVIRSPPAARYPDHQIVTKAVGSGFDEGMRGLAEFSGKMNPAFHPRAHVRKLERFPCRAIVKPLRQPGAASNDFDFLIGTGHSQRVAALVHRPALQHVGAQARRVVRIGIRDGLCGGE